MNSDEHRIELCNAALQATSGLLTPEVFTEIDDYINKHDEWGIGIEALIDFLCEEKCQISPEQFEKIQTAMESMGLGQTDRIESLGRQVK